jgi:hypothetical protein
VAKTGAGAVDGLSEEGGAAKRGLRIELIGFVPVMASPPGLLLFRASSPEEGT